MITADLDRIGAQTGVSAAISDQHDDSLAYQGMDYDQMRTFGENLGLRMARSPTRDFDISVQRRNLAQAVVTLVDLQSDGHRAYVHCTADVGRVPLTALSYLAWVEGCHGRTRSV